MKITKRQMKRIISEELSAAGVIKSRRPRRIVISRQELQTLREHKIPIPKNVRVKRQQLNEIVGIDDIVVGTTISVLLQMLSTADGRNRLADMIVAIPELQARVCEAWGAPGAVAGAVEGAATGEPGAFTRGVSAISGVAKKLCRFSVLKIGGAPLNLLAYILRQMSDEEAAVITGSVGEQPALPGPTKPDIKALEQGV